MSKILKNNTGSIVALADVGQSVPASGQLMISPSDYDKYAQSNDVIIKISDSTLTVNDGSVDLSISDGVDLIKGYFPKQINTYFQDDQIDNKNNLKVSQILNLFGYHFAQSQHALWSNKKTTGSAAINLNTQRAALVLSTTTANSDTAIWQTKKVIKYTIGKGHLVTISATVGTGKSGLTKNWGYFNDNNGWFFSQENGTNYIVMRSNVSGSVVDTKIAQTSWNIDKLDGNGPSGINWSFVNSGIYAIEFTWHGNGIIRFGVQYNGKTYFCHKLMLDNTQPYPAVRNPILPIRIEIKNTSSTASISEFNLHAVSANKYGTEEGEAIAQFTASRTFNEKGIVDNAYRPLLSLRPKLTFNGRPNQIMIKPMNMSVYSDAQPIYVQVLLNPTTITGASWTSVGDDSACEYDTAATVVSGGTIIFEDYVAASTTVLTGSSANITHGGLSHYILGLDIDAAIADVIVINVRSLGGGSNCAAVIRWEEFQ